MRLRALAVALLLPVGLLAACGSEDNGLTSGLQQTGDPTPTTEDEPDTTTADADEALEETEETEETEDPEVSDDAEDAADLEDLEDLEDIDDSLFPDDAEAPTDETTDDETTDDETTGDSLPPEARAEVVDAILAEYPLSEEQAGCMVDELVAIIGIEGLDEMASAGGTPTLDPDQMGEVIEVFTTCDIDPTVLMG